MPKGKGYKGSAVLEYLKEEGDRRTRKRKRQRSYIKPKMGDEIFQGLTPAQAARAIDYIHKKHRQVGYK